MSQTFTLQKLRAYDGKGADVKIYVALKDTVFDVTEKGATFYGTAGPYNIFAGRDASRGLATMSMTVKDDYDDLGDLTAVQKEGLDNWHKQFTAKYKVMGKLVKP